MRKGCGFLGAGCLTLVVGAGAMGGVIYSKVSGITDAIQQVPGPGTQEITLTEVGSYTIFYEHQSEYGGKVYDTRPYLDRAVFTLRPKEGGSEVPVRSAKASGTYSLGSRQGKSVAEFTIDRPGTYLFTSEVSGADEVIFGVGHGFLGEVMGAILIPLVIGFGSFFTAIVLLIVGLVKFIRAGSEPKAA